MLTRQTGEKQGSDYLGGPFGAKDAHEKCRELIEAPGPVIGVHVFSLTESQFIGAYYKRGDSQQPWHELEEPDERVELQTQAPPEGETDAAPLQDEPEGPADDEPVRPGDALRDASPAAPAVPRDRAVRSVPPKKQAAPRALGVARTQTTLELDPGNAEQWPKSETAQTVRAFLDGGKRATSKDICEALGPKLTALGVAFPASLVSRLKQGGLLRPSTEE